jgi:hypothetical protein
MSLGAYGTFRFHEWVARSNPDGALADAYGVFRNRGAALGWERHGGSPEPASSLWGIEEGDVYEAQPGELAAAFQVSRTDAAPDGVAVQAFVSCVSEAIDRLGTLTLTRVQILVPPEAVRDASEASSSGKQLAAAIHDGAVWFLFDDDRAEARMHIDLRTRLEGDCGNARSLRDWLMDIVADGRFAHVWTLEEDVTLPHTGSHSLSFDGRLCDRSLEATGWLSAFLSDGAHRNGFNCPLEIEVTFR